MNFETQAKFEYNQTCKTRPQRQGFLGVIAIQNKTWHSRGSFQQSVTWPFLEFKKFDFNALVCQKKVKKCIVLF